MPEWTTVIIGGAITVLGAIGFFKYVRNKYLVSSAQWCGRIFSKWGTVKFGKNWQALENGFFAGAELWFSAFRLAASEDNTKSEP